jgi:predicted GIY-YIG superfamily endonuclease
VAGVIYLLRFDRPIGDAGNPRSQAQHYLGWASDLDARLGQHRSGSGARLMEVINAAGIPRDWRERGKETAIRRGVAPLRP